MLHFLLDYLYEDDNNSLKRKTPPQQQREKKRRSPKGVAFYVDETGVRRVLPPRMSNWYGLYIENANIGNQCFEKKFRRRFRMPYTSFLELVELTKGSCLFSRWRDDNHDAVGKKPAPIELLLLASLRYLGRGWTFDDLSESTAVSEEVIRLFFHRFIEFGSTELFDRWVIQPTIFEHANSQTHEYTKAGLPGAIGSMDATHVVLERVNYRLRQSHLGHKFSCTARTYNIVCNHRRRILSTTEGHPARWNDKSIVKFDPFVMGIKEGILVRDHSNFCFEHSYLKIMILFACSRLRTGTLLQDFTFSLYEYDHNGAVVTREYKGPWILCDNGYHKSWSMTIAPFKETTSRLELRFSQWLESMRKDVECTFGIMKGRWRILKTGI